MTKKERQLKILQIISTHTVRTQEELLLLLKEEGCIATQATLSRDMKELHLQKISDAKKGIHYVVRQNATPDEEHTFIKYKEVLHHVLLSAVSAENIAVLRTLSGTASAAGAALETFAITGLIGTLAGDDTLLCIFSSADAAASFCSGVEKDYLAVR